MTTLGDDLHSRAEAEMRMHDAKMVEAARMRRLREGPMDARVAWAVERSGGDAAAALELMRTHELCGPDDDPEKLIEQFKNMNDAEI